MTLHNTPAPMPKKMKKNRDTAPPTTAYSFGTLVCSFNFVDKRKNNGGRLRTLF
jgi:hypothetical protein